MGDVINLNKARKQRDKARDVAKASENVTRFGRSAAQKSREADDLARAKALLDGHAVPPKDPSETPPTDPV